MKRGFTIIELLIGLAITALLMTGLFAAIYSSVDAYSRCSAEGVNRLTSRLLVQRIALIVRTGVSFGPLPSVSTEDLVESDTIEITTSSGQEVIITWDSASESLIMDVDGTISTVLGGVTQDVDGTPITPFLLQYENGITLRRVTINLVVIPDPEHHTAMDDIDSTGTVRLTASVMPRKQLYE